MSDEGEKTCPLCAEEMDLTDQQLKPCKCGYEICVWCWHHIMDMAEKDETEGRCPACRTPYNKEKIVGTAASCERLVSEINVEKKKSHKVKSKTSEGRKHLASVRVIQRNLVYVVGLPLNFADEDLLQRREYFGQYGKVLKVSISRTASGAIQHSANSTCSVYITYSKEEDAVRCIQSVHGFVLDGRSLRACFGTTKYCHAWLRNMPCGNPECLYLHEVGSQEDSFTKDEIISAYSRVQRITGSSNSALRRTGIVLPPPTDEYCSNTSPAKPITKAAVNTNISADNARFSPPNSSSGRCAALPAGASWGTRASNNQTSVGSMQSSNGPPRQKSDVCNGPVVSSSTVTESPSQISSMQSDTAKPLLPNKESFISQNKRKPETGEPVKKESSPDQRTTVSESSFTSVHSATLPLNRQQNGSSPTNLPPSSANDVDSSITSSRLATNRETTDGSVDNICSDILAMGIHDKQNLENGNVKCVIREPVASQTSVPAVDTSELGLADVQSDCRLHLPTQVTQVDLHETENHLTCFDKQKLKDPERVAVTKPEFCYASSRPKHSNMYSSLCADVEADTNGSISTDLDRTFVDRNSNLIVQPTFPSGYSGTQVKGQEVKEGEFSNLSKERLFLGGYGGEPAKGAADVGESSIISNILSMNFDSWDDTLTSPHDLAKLMGETDQIKGFLGVPGSLKIQNSNQSRFSFAREDESISQVSSLGQSMDCFEKGFLQHSLGNDISNSSGIQLEMLANHSGFPVVNISKSNISSGGYSDMPSNRLSVSRSQISAPPGFSAPGRAPPPPGFNSHERTDQKLDMVAGNHMLDVNSLFRNHYQTASSANNTISNGDIEFMDPAILAVGKGILPGGINNPGVDLQPSYSSQLNPYEDARFRSLLQRSLPHQNQRFTDMGDGYAAFGDAYGIPSRFLEQKLANNLSPLSQFSFTQSRNGLSSHGQLDGWNDMQSGSSLGMADMLRTDRFGFNKFYSGYVESKVRTPSSGNLNNGTYGI